MFIATTDTVVFQVKFLAKISKNGQTSDKTYGVKTLLMKLSLEYTEENIFKATATRRPLSSEIVSAPNCSTTTYI